MDGHFVVGAFDDIELRKRDFLNRHAGDLIAGLVEAAGRHSEEKIGQAGRFGLVKIENVHLDSRPHVSFLIGGIRAIVAPISRVQFETEAFEALPHGVSIVVPGREIHVGVARNRSPIAIDAQKRSEGNPDVEPSIFRDLKDISLDVPEVTLDPFANLVPLPAAVGLVVDSFCQSVEHRVHPHKIFEYFFNFHNAWVPGLLADKPSCME